MNTCATCKWWQPTGDGRGECALGESENSMPVFPASKCVAYDNEDYAAIMLTDSDFGCVQWAKAGE